MLSHELRTPLTPVIARLALLRRDNGLSPEVQSAIEMIRRNVELEARLIDDLLDMTRITRGNLQLKFENVDAHQKMRNAVEIYQTEMKDKDLRLITDLSATRHHVRADPARFQQVLWNLVSNAVKYTPVHGEIRVSSRNEDDSLVMQVSDSGIGIEPDVMERLFDPFEQGEQSLSRRFGGLGLGLSISRRLMQMHGGRLLAASEGKGRGATFTISISVRQPARRRSPPSACATCASCWSRTTRTRFARCRGCCNPAGMLSRRRPT